MMTPDLLFEYGLTVIVLLVIAVFVMASMGMFDK